MKKPKPKKWVTSDNALIFTVVQEKDSLELSVVDDGDGSPIILALDTDGVDEVIQFLEEARKHMVTLAGPPKEEESDEEEEEEGEEEEGEEEEEEEEEAGEPGSVL